MDEIHYLRFLIFLNFQKRAPFSRASVQLLLGNIARLSKYEYTIIYLQNVSDIATSSSTEIDGSLGSAELVRFGRSEKFRKICFHDMIRYYYGFHENVEMTQECDIFMEYSHFQLPGI